MSFYRITNPSGVTTVSVDDLGIDIAPSAVTILSDQFSVKDLYLSADLEALIITSTLTVEIDFGIGFTSVAAGSYTNRDTLAGFLNVFEITNENNNEDLVDGSDASPLHIHDARYFTETELGAITGAALIGADDSACPQTFSDVQDALVQLCNTVGTGDLDSVYDNDADGIMDVDGTTKDLNLRSDNANDILISRTNGADSQNGVQLDVSGDEVLLGALLSGALAQLDVRVISNLVVDGNITFTGTITDTTVNNLEVLDANILLRTNAASGADASVSVERGATGADASVKWNETTDVWEAGLVGSTAEIITDINRIIASNFVFGGGTTDPDFRLLEKASNPTTNLGVAGEIPVTMRTNGILAVFDKSNSRNKFLSVQREYMVFCGRDNMNNQNEYARLNDFTSNQAGSRLIRASTLVGMSIQTNGVETWDARVRKNGVVTDLATLTATAVAGEQAGTFNVDFSAGDEVQVFIDSASGINRPVIKLEFAVTT